LWIYVTSISIINSITWETADYCITRWNYIIRYNNDKIETKSPAIIDEIIPSKNNDFNNKFNNQNNNDNIQQPLIENHNEKESALAVIEAMEEFKKL